MPIGLPAASLIGGGISAVGGALSTWLNNRAQRKLTMDMYNLQRKDALADWERQTAYEAPSAQMARFKAAGLNPNLVFSQQTNSPTVRGVSMDVPRLSPIPVPEIGAAIGQYQAIKKQQAQTDLTEQVIALTAAKEALVGLQAFGQSLENAKKEMTNDQFARLKDTYFETSLATLENLQARNQMAWQGVEYGARTMEDRVATVGKRLAQMDASINKIVEETINIQEMRPYKKREITARINNLMASTEGKNLDNQFKRLTMADRATAIEYTMEILGARKSGADYDNKLKSLEVLLKQNGVDMMGIRNTMETIQGIKDIVNPFKGMTKTVTTQTQTPKGKYSSTQTTKQR